MTTATATPAATTPVSTLLVQGLLGGASAAVANVALFFAARTLGVSMEGEFQPGTVAVLPVVMVAVSSVVPALPAAFAALGMERFTSAGARNYGILAAVLAVASFGGPAGVPGASAATKAVMDLMHLVAAAGIAGFQVRAMRR